MLNRVMLIVISDRCDQGSVNGGFQTVVRVWSGNQILLPPSWEKEAIRHPAPVRKVSLPKEIGVTEERFRWYIWFPWFLEGSCIYDRRGKRLFGGQKGFPKRLSFGGGCVRLFSSLPSIPCFISFLPLFAFASFNLKWASALSGISNHGLEPRFADPWCDSSCSYPSPPQAMSFPQHPAGTWKILCLLENQELSGTRTTGIFSKVLLVQMGGVLRYN